MGPTALRVDNITHIHLQLYIQFYKLKPTTTEYLRLTKKE